MPLYSDGVLDEVRDAVNIVSLVSEYVTLKKRGRNHVARCPFHVEKTPSFNVSEEKQIFMCFGCGVGGDVFKFVMQMENVSFPESVRFIAERYGISLPQSEASSRPESGSDLGLLRDVMVRAGDYFHRALLRSEEGRSPLAYLKDRGVTAETIDRFKLGYAPSKGTVVNDFFRKQGVPVEVLLECGLVKRAEDANRLYDTFRGRIMFPITDIRGRIIAFGGRALGDRQPKYLNSPETKLYNKSRNLFGLSYSRGEIQKLDQAVLVEGYMDYLIPFQYGIQNLVASLGTSLTPQQVKLLGRYTRDVIVSYDPDYAGIAATQRSLDLFLEGDFRVKVFQLPDGQDPDSYVRSVGAEEYRKNLQDSASYLDFVLDMAIRSRRDWDNPKNKVRILNVVLPYLAKIPSAVERSEYVFRFAHKLNIEDQQLLAEVKRAARQKQSGLRKESTGAIGSMKFAEKRLLQLLLRDKELQSHILPQCTREDFRELAAEGIFVCLLEASERGGIVTFDELHRQFGGREEQTVLARLQMEEVPESTSLETAESFLSALRQIRLTSRKQEILSKILEATEKKDEEFLNRLIEQRAQVDRELISLSRK